MRILVYGAGVQGCELAHRLAQNEKNTVTLLARGEWKERIDQKGLTIRHWAQLKTTVDRVPTIETLAPEESYDIVFVTVQAGQLPEILPVLKQNKSEFFVFVGNQPHARSVLQAMQRPAGSEPDLCFYHTTEMGNAQAVHTDPQRKKSSLVKGSETWYSKRAIASILSDMILRGVL